MVMYPYGWQILEWDKNAKTNKQVLISKTMLQYSYGKIIPMANIL